MPSLVESDIPQEMKTLLCLHFSFVINLPLCYKSHALLWSEMHNSLVNWDNFARIFLKIVTEICQYIFSCTLCQVVIFKIWWQHCVLTNHFFITQLLVFYYAVALLRRIKNGCLHILFQTLVVIARSNI